jgi:hypothetical protein
MYYVSLTSEEVSFFDFGVVEIKRGRGLRAHARIFENNFFRQCRWAEGRIGGPKMKNENVYFRVDSSH